MARKYLVGQVGMCVFFLKCGSEFGITQAAVRGRNLHLFGPGLLCSLLVSASSPPTLLPLSGLSASARQTSVSLPHMHQYMVLRFTDSKTPSKETQWFCGMVVMMDQFYQQLVALKRACDEEKEEGDDPALNISSRPLVSFS